METERLTRPGATSDTDHGDARNHLPSTQRSARPDGFHVINRPLHEMSLKTQIQVTSLIKREPLMQAMGKSVSVEFARGPLGLQLADVGRRVLVTAFDTPAGQPGQPGQAEKSGLVEVGYQMVGVAGRSCLGLPMAALLELVEAAPRPVAIEFQPLIIPRYPSKARESIFDQLGQRGELQDSGAPAYEVEFAEKFLGLNVGDVQDTVVVSQFVKGGDEALLANISLGDRISRVRFRAEADVARAEVASKAKQKAKQKAKKKRAKKKAKKKKQKEEEKEREREKAKELGAGEAGSGEAGEAGSESDESSSSSSSSEEEDDDAEAVETWTERDCSNCGYAEVAAIVRDAGRPVRITFTPTTVVVRPPKGAKHLRKEMKRLSSGSLRLRCPGCQAKGPRSAKFCWKCGQKLPQPQDAQAQFQSQAQAPGNASASGGSASASEATSDLLDFGGFAEGAEGAEAEVDLFGAGAGAGAVAGASAGASDDGVEGEREAIVAEVEKADVNLIDIGADGEGQDQDQRGEVLLDLFSEQ